MLTQKRNYGIDLLRVVSMIMVVILHILSQGGILKILPELSAKYSLMWFLEIASYCAVNCYALISGYTGYGRKFKPSGIVSLWFQVVFYTAGITILFKLLTPQPIGAYQIVTSFFPVSFDIYWYFTAYFALFFFTPFLNRMMENLSKRAASLLVIGLALILSVFLTCIGNVFSFDLFNLNYGYSPLWLLVLYLIGAYVKKYQFGFNIKKKIWLIIYFISIFITLLAKMLVPILSRYIGFFTLFEDVLIDYTSPTILLCAISLLIFFANLNLRATFCKIISFFSTCTFAVYIIHLQPNIWEFLNNRFVSYADFNVAVLVLAVIGTALGIWLTASLVDKVRQLLFKLIRIDTLANKIASLVQRVVNKIADGLQKLTI